MKKYLEDNFQNRSDLINRIERTPEDEARTERKQFEGVGPRAKEGEQVGKVCPQPRPDGQFGVNPETRRCAQK